MPRKKSTPPVEFDELLTAEYNYIAQTAAQATEDRARVSSFYLVAVGSLVAAMFGTQLFDPDKFTQTIKLMFSGLFLLLTLLGIFTVLQLARLRAAWHDAMLAMNQIKEFAIRQNPEIAAAFRWHSGSLPPRFKRNSVSYFQTQQVATVSGLMFGAAAFFLQQAFFQTSAITWIIAVVFGLLLVRYQINLYANMTK